MWCGWHRFRILAAAAGIGLSLFGVYPAMAQYYPTIPRARPAITIGQAMVALFIRPTAIITRCCPYSASAAASTTSWKSMSSMARRDSTTAERGTNLS